MPELTINAEDIAAALARNVSDFTAGTEAEQVGRIAEVGDGIARVTGLPGATVNELLEFENGTVGLALNLDEESIGAVVLGTMDGLDEGQVVRSTGRILSVPVGDALLGRVVNPLGEPIDGKGPLGATVDRRLEIQAPGIVSRQPVSEPLQTGIKVIDAMTPIGRGQRELIIGDRKTGQDDDRHRHDHQPARRRGEVHLRRRRPEGIDDLADRRDPRRARRAGLHRRRRRARLRAGAVQVPRTVCRLRDGPALDGERRARARRLRRPFQASRGLPPALAPAAPSAGPGGLPGRRLLPPQPSARAGGEALRRDRRRLAHGAADHRDQGGRHLGLHPDQRHLDHRRPDLPRERPVLLGRAAGVQRRQLGVPGRWRGADQGDEVGRRARSRSTWRSSGSSRRSPPSAPSSTRRPRPSSTAAIA